MTFRCMFNIGILQYVTYIFGLNIELVRILKDRTIFLLLLYANHCH